MVGRPVVRAVVLRPIEPMGPMHMALLSQTQSAGWAYLSTSQTVRPVQAEPALGEAKKLV